VRIKDGDTVVIGGLIRHDKGEVITKVPFLGDIPLLGKLFFTNRATTPNRERELLVFITPRIVNNANKVELAQTITPAFPVREQDTASGLNRQLAVATSLDKFETR
jgi:type II secretory pathway component GspD/PulD (secretin)